jgi:hypothetical protein
MTEFFYNRALRGKARALNKNRINSRLEVEGMRHV